MAKSYLPSYKRAKTPPAMRLTERDKQIISAVHHYRLLSSEHVEALFFATTEGKSHSRRSACQRRLQLLFHHAYLDRLLLPLIMGEGRSPFVYALGEAGVNFVAAESGINRSQVGWKPKANHLGAMFLDHTLAINDFRIVVNLLAQNGVWKVNKWSDESIFRTTEDKDQVPFQIKRGQAVRAYPDGYFALEFPNTIHQPHFFLEVDRGTMSNTRWQDKIKAYTQFRASGRSQKYYGTQNFRVLTVTTSWRRLDNLRAATEEVGGSPHFWFTTQAHIDIWHPEKLLEPVWAIATQQGAGALTER